MGLWGGSTGFKLFVLKMETADAPEKVASFYRKALAKYGTVLWIAAMPPRQPLRTPTVKKTQNN